MVDRLRVRVCLLRIITILLATGTSLTALPTGGYGESRLAPEVADRVAKELESRRFATTTEGVRGLRDLFAASVHGVPLIITKGGIGSGVVAEVSPTTAVGLVVTNHHVIASAFHDKEGRAFVILVFYEPKLAQEPFDGARVANCLTSSIASSWCVTFRRVVRAGFVVGSDADQDLALVAVSELPLGIGPIPFGNLDDIRPGDEVSVIGHPLGLVWSLTTGIVSAVRSNYPIGSSPSAMGTTVVQTQAPVHPGNSGGPLLTTRGHLVGVIFGSRLLPTRTDTGADSGIAAAGLNMAIAVTEVRGFIAKRR